MKKQKHIICIVLALSFLLMTLSGCGCAAKTQSDQIDYSDEANWVYYGIGADRSADLFIVCPTVDMGAAGNSNMSMTDESTKQKFVGALNMERGIYEDSLTLYAPYYRQATFPVYSMSDAEAEPYFELAYADVRSAFLAYIAASEPGRPFVLAGFSQGADMVLRLLEEFFDEDGYQGRLIAAYCIGWRVTDADLAEYPWLNMATCADDTGVIVTFSSEAENITESLIVPEGVKTHAINPLNWRTDATYAGKDENLGACFTNYSGEITKEIPNLTGAYISETRGTLILPDIDPADYANSLFPDGVYHLYDYQFFFRNLQANVALRLEAYLSACALDNAA